MRAMTIGQAARKAGVGVETIRFYERKGLIPQPPKTGGAGFRVYPDETVMRIRFIRQAQQLGFSLREIGELLALRADPAADCAAVREQAVAKLREVWRKVGELQRIGTALQSLIAACPGEGALEACSILDRLKDVQKTAANPGQQDQQPTRRPAERKSRSTNHDPAKEENLESLTMKIEGMHCEGCAETVKVLLDREPGVKTAAVSFQRGEARVLYDPRVTSAEQLIATVEKPGYRVVDRGP